jgi:hypothetical protein
MTMDDKLSTKLKEELNKFKLSHYENADFDNLTKKTVSLYKKFGRLKDKKKQNSIVLDLYTLYLQITEILFINAHALSVNVNNFPSALFISSSNLKKFIEENCKTTTQFSTWFLLNPVFTSTKGDDDFKERYSLYSSLLKEVAKDYLDDFDMLNAYKHGYRIKAKHDKAILSIITGNGQHFKLDESDSTIVYFSKETVDGIPTIFEHSLSFKIDRIFVKCIFICSLLNNIRASTLLYYKKKLRGKNISRFHINDKEAWRKAFGGSHIKSAIFSLKKL